MMLLFRFRTCSLVSAFELFSFHLAVELKSFVNERNANVLEQIENGIHREKEKYTHMHWP